MISFLGYLHCNTSFKYLKRICYVTVKLPTASDILQTVDAPAVIHINVIQSPTFVPTTEPVIPTVLEADPKSICWLAFCAIVVIPSLPTILISSPSVPDAGSV